LPSAGAAATFSDDLLQAAIDAPNSTIALHAIALLNDIELLLSKSEFVILSEAKNLASPVADPSVAQAPSG
jgi:hypothetical protein